MGLASNEGLGVTWRLNAGVRNLLVCAEKSRRTPVFDFSHKSSENQCHRDNCRGAPVGKTADVAETQTNDGDNAEPSDEMLWR